MKTLVNALAAAVQKAPWIVIAVTVVLTMILGSFASKFQPADDQNASFAPEAPELTAATYISDTFGAVSRMQVLATSSTGDVITLDALNAAVALAETVNASDSAELLVDLDQAPAVLSYLAPVFFAVEGGAPFPTNDAEVKALYVAGFEEVPPEFRSFLVALLSDEANFETATAELGLSAITYRSTDDPDEQASRAVGLAEAVNLAPIPDSITLDPFSVELIFGDSAEFEKEIARLFAAAALIILLVLATIFLVKPKGSRDRGVFIVGLGLMFIGSGIAVVPGLAQIFPDLFPESWGDLDVGPVLLAALAFYVVAFIIWTFTSRRLRRTTADTVLTFVTILIGIQWMNGYGFLRFEDASPMAQILPILLIGLGVDYSIHMTTRYRQELVAGRSVDESMRTAIRTVGVALVLATLTTAVGFLTNVTNDLPALAEFGEMAAVGIGASFLLMLTFVPAVRELLDRKAEKAEHLDTGGLESGDSRILPKIVGKSAILPRRFATATLIVALALTGLGAYGMTGLSTEFSFLDFVPTNSPLRDTAVTVSERFDFPETTSVLVQGDVATGAAWNSMVAAYSDSSGVADVQTIDRPNGQTVSTGQTFVSVMFGLLDPDSPVADPSVLTAAMSAGFEQQTFPPDADLVPLYDAAVAGNPAALASVLAADEGGYAATLFNFDTLAGESRAAELSTGLNDAFAITDQAGLESVSTSTFIINNLVIQSLTDSQLSSLLLTMGAALLLLVINFFFESRRPMLGVITTVPVVVVVIMVFGIMAALRIPFGPVTATISALGIGIGIPYMIHVTHRYLEERLVWPDENEAIEQTLTHTGGALAGSAVTTMLGFGILITSTTIPFRQFGFVLAYTILLALLAAVLILPSMLVLWDRWHRRRGDAEIDQIAMAAATPES
ncbi:MAG: RND family transporter [Acidimicrobiia bacterium]